MLTIPWEKKLKRQDIKQLYKNRKKMLEKIIGSEQFPFKIGYSNSFQIEEQTKKENKKTRSRRRPIWFIKISINK